MVQISTRIEAPVSGRSDQLALEFAEKLKDARPRKSSFPIPGQLRALKSFFQAAYNHFEAAVKTQAAVSSGVMTWGAVGSSVFAGAQGGWRPSGPVEVGAFGGFLSLATTTEPAFDQGTAGAYWQVEKSSRDLSLRHQGRLAVVEGVPAGGGFEAELMGEAWLWRELDLTAQLRYGSRTGTLEYGAADLTWRRAGRFSLLASYRHFDLPAAEPAAPAVYPGRTDHLEGAATLESLGNVYLR